jgi:TRAP transporter 4TM/12TM fusion protein
VTDSAAGAAPGTLARLGARLFAAVCAGYALFHIYTAAQGPFAPLVQRGIFIGVAVFLALWSLAQPGAKGSPALRALLLVLALVGLVGGLHAAASEARFMDVMNDLTRVDALIAAGLLLALLAATQRMLGWSLPVLTVIGLVYYAFGNTLISGTWQPPRVSLDTMLTTLYGSTSGVFGFMADIGTSVIAIYVIYGSLLMATGAGEVFVQVATRVAGRGHGGPAKVAVVTSALFGTVSGSAVANVMAVGTLTIPTMARAGYPKAFAAGVEASASAGGQIMPPIMGAGAFLMAELLNVPYLNVALAAALPAVLYFAVIFISVDLYARRHQLARDAAPRTPIDSHKAIPLALSVGALILMLVRGYTPTMAGAVASGVLLLAAAGFRLLAGVRGGRVAAELGLFGRNLWDGLVDGGKGLIMIAVLLGCAGILTSVLSASGLGSKFSSELISLAGSHLLTALVLAALLCILLGMDVPTTASYVLTASVAAPLLTKLGLPPLTAHLFIFYFAILSAITPPVCASVYAASAIAQQRFWTVAKYAMIVAAAVYVIPFMFVYRPALLLPAPPMEVAYALAVTLLAMVSACGATIGYLAGPTGWAGRAWLLATATLFFIPGPVYDAGALLMLAGFVAVQFVRRRRAAAASPAEGSPQ